VRATRDTTTRDRLQTHPHMSAKATAKQATADHLGRGTRGPQRGPARHPSKVVQAGPAQGHECTPTRAAIRRQPGGCSFTERGGIKGPPAGDKTRCNHTHEPQSKATQREAKPNQKPQTPTQGAKQAQGDIQSAWVKKGTFVPATALISACRNLHFNFQATAVPRLSTLCQDSRKWCAPDDPLNKRTPCTFGMRPSHSGAA
jgi:hypothetical protein